MPLAQQHRKLPQNNADQTEEDDDQVFTQHLGFLSVKAQRCTQKMNSNSLIQNAKAPLRRKRRSNGRLIIEDDDMNTNEDIEVCDDVADDEVLFCMTLVM